MRKETFKGEIEYNPYMCFLKRGFIFVNSRSFPRIDVTSVIPTSQLKDLFGDLTPYLEIIMLSFVRYETYKGEIESDSSMC